LDVVAEVVLEEDDSKRMKYRSWILSLLASINMVSSVRREGGVCPIMHLMLPISSFVFCMYVHAGVRRE
jgi:hypothetical protein